MNGKKIKIISAAFACSLAFIALLGHSALSTQPAAAGTAGTREDPLVTAGYVSRYVREVVEETVNRAMQNITVACQCPPTENIILSASGGAAVLEPLRLTQNQRIRAATGSLEVIVRPNASAAVMSNHVYLGVADLTTGRELLHGESVPTNHVLLIPRADNRGLYITSEVAYIFVRGEYIISE